MARTLYAPPDSWTVASRRRSAEKQGAVRVLDRDVESELGLVPVHGRGAIGEQQRCEDDAARIRVGEVLELVGEREDLVLGLQDFLAADGDGRLERLRPAGPVHHAPQGACKAGAIAGAHEQFLARRERAVFIGADACEQAIINGTAEEAGSDSGFERWMHLSDLPEVVNARRDLAIRKLGSEIRISAVADHSTIVTLEGLDNLNACIKKATSTGLVEADPSRSYRRRQGFDP
jgi:hypothetical protein